MGVVKNFETSKYYSDYLKIKELLNENPFYTISDIADKLKIPKNIVHRIYSMFKINVRKLREETIVRDVKEYKMSYKEIASLYGIGYNTVSSVYIRATGRRRKRVVGRNITKKDILKAFKKHKGMIRYAAKSLGWNPSLLKKKIEELGIMEEVRKLGYEPYPVKGKVKELILLKYKNKKPSNIKELIEECKSFTQPSYVRRVAKKYSLFEEKQKIRRQR